MMAIVIKLELINVLVSIDDIALSCEGYSHK
jgi:hypothetical protein